MTADTSEATADYSTRPAPTRGRQSALAQGPRGLVALRGLLALAGLAGVILLVLSTWVTVVQIRVLTTSELITQDTQISGGDLHGIALVLVAVFALAMLVGGVRGARPAMLALAVSGALALGLVIGLDVPELDNTGQVAKFYEDVSAGASTGFYLETLGGVLLLVAGGLLWLLAADSASERWSAAGRRVGAFGGAVGSRLGAGAGAVRHGAGAGAASVGRRAKAGAAGARERRGRGATPSPAPEPPEDAPA